MPGLISRASLVGGCLTARSIGDPSLVSSTLEITSELDLTLRLRLVCGTAHPNSIAGTQSVRVLREAFAHG